MKALLNTIDGRGWLLPVLALICLPSACGQAPLIHITGQTMGTGYSVKVVNSAVAAGDLESRIELRLAELNGIFSTYMPASELSLLNAGRRTGVKVSPELREVLAMSEEVSRLSGGAFDVSIGALVNLWGFGPDGPAAGVPTPAALREALSSIGFRRLELTAQGVRKPASMLLDLSAIAKGHAVDEICELLEAQGAGDYLVEIGGEVRAGGVNARGGDWIVGIEAPDARARRLHRTIPVRDLAMATSGDYRNFFEYGGRRYSHTLDPRTGWPVRHNLASVTVLHPSAGFADGLATAFSVLGPAETMRIANAHGFLVLAIIRDEGSFEEIHSNALTDYLAAK